MVMRKTVGYSGGGEEQESGSEGLISCAVGYSACEGKDSGRRILVAAVWIY